MPARIRLAPAGRALANRTVPLVLLALTACGGPAPVCRFDDLDDVTVSTRKVFLERLAGCPIGGRN